MPVVCARNKTSAKLIFKRRFGKKINFSSVRLLRSTPQLSCDTYSADYKGERHSVRKRR